MAYPRTGAGTHQDQLFIRDVDFINYHINHDKWRLIKLLDIIDTHRIVDDFCYDLSSRSARWNFSTTEGGSGTASYSCTDLVNGVALIQNDDADDDNVEVTQYCECWKLVKGYPLYAEMRLKLSDADESDFWFGLITGTTWFTEPDDFVVFHKDDGDESLYAKTSHNAADSDKDTGYDFSDLTWVRIGFHYDGDDKVTFFVFEDGDAPQTLLKRVSIESNIPHDEDLALGFGIQNGEAASKALYVDYVKCTQKRVIE